MQVNRYVFNFNLKDFKAGKICPKVALRIINLGILLCSMVGLSRTIVTDSGECLDGMYKIWVIFFLQFLSFLSSNYDKFFQTMKEA